MKKIFKLLLSFLVLLCSYLCAFASDEFNVMSVVYDNSASFLAINSYASDTYNFTNIPQLHIVEDEKKVYFDIDAGVLRCASQDIILNSPHINEILVKQFSANPNIVRVVIKYNEGFNPEDIKLKLLNNTLFVVFAQPKLQNFYFQQVYTDTTASAGKFYETTAIQVPVLAAQSTASQINAAFNINQEKNYILAKKELVFPSKLYINSVVQKGAVTNLIGTGTFALTKPFVLSSPTRLVYDIPNAVVNPSLRNKEYTLAQDLTLKVGQFDRETARIVLTGESVQKYRPVMSNDSQKLIFAEKTPANIQIFGALKVVLNSVTDEKNDEKTHSLKIVFSKPVFYSINKSAASFDVDFYNVNKSNVNVLKTAFQGAKLTLQKDGYYTLSFPITSNDEVTVHSGLDGKTLRIKMKSDNFVNVDLKPVAKKSTIAKPSSVVAKKIVIDPGHGGTDCGATRNNIYEKDIVLDISKRVVSMLQKKGYDVYVTRSSDETVSLQDRVEISENNSPEIFVSIHVNSSNSDSPNGIETHYYKDNSLMLAKTMHAAMLNNIKANDRGLFKSKFYVINHTTAPAVLLEIGFISNAAERAQLVTESRKQATAKAIAEGIDEYLKKY